MSGKLISQLDFNGYFIGPVMADESPLEPGVYHIPFGAVDATPPCVPAGKRAKFSENHFILEDAPAIQEQPPTAAAPLTKEQQEAFVTKGLGSIVFTPAEQRAFAYAKESDPLFFKAQRGEATMDEWKAKIESIKAKYPDSPVVPTTVV